MFEESSYCPPEFEITVTRKGDVVQYVRAVIDGRLHNVHYYGARYIAGDEPPRYPVPTLLGECFINPQSVILMKADYWANDDAAIWRRN